jgi:hypothetical protein
MTLASLAPVAEAAHGKKWRKKNRHETRVVIRDYAPSYRHAPRYRSSRYVVRRSNSGAIIAGFIGGLFLGATIANAAPAGYTYYDPYCHDHYSSLNTYYSHCRSHRHPHEVQVVAVRTDHRYDDRYRDRQWCDDCERWYRGDDHDHRHHDYDD